MYLNYLSLTNNKTHQTRRKCTFCGEKLEFYDYDSEEGLELFMCPGCNAQDIVENGKRKFIELF